MSNPSNKRPALADGTGVNFQSLRKYLEQAVLALEEEGEHEAAHYFSMLREHLDNDVRHGTQFGFTYKSLGL